MVGPSIFGILKWLPRLNSFKVTTPFEPEARLLHVGHSIITPVVLGMPLLLTLIFFLVDAKIILNILLCAN